MRGILREIPPHSGFQRPVKPFYYACFYIVVFGSKMMNRDVNRSSIFETVSVASMSA